MPVLVQIVEELEVGLLLARFLHRRRQVLRPLSPVRPVAADDGVGRARLHRGLPDLLQLRGGVGGEAVDGHDDRNAELARDGDLLDEVAAAYAPRLKWDTKFTATGLANRNLVGQSFLFKCPQAAGNLMPRRVYGTDQYAFNSYVCQAAVHAGRITHAGGYVQVKLEAAQGKLQGSTRHGIESKNGPAGSRVISFGDVVHPVTPVAGG